VAEATAHNDSAVLTQTLKPMPRNPVVPPRNKQFKQMLKHRQNILDFRTQWKYGPSEASR
jgi:hypothetical protein